MGWDRGGRVERGVWWWDGDGMGVRWGWGGGGMGVRWGWGGGVWECDLVR